MERRSKNMLIIISSSSSIIIIIIIIILLLLLSLCDHVTGTLTVSYACLTQEQCTAEARGMFSGARNDWSWSSNVPEYHVSDNKRLQEVSWLVSYWCLTPSQLL